MNHLHSAPIWEFIVSHWLGESAAKFGLANELPGILPVYSKCFQLNLSVTSADTLTSSAAAPISEFTHLNQTGEVFIVVVSFYFSMLQTSFNFAAVTFFMFYVQVCNFQCVTSGQFWRQPAGPTLRHYFTDCSDEESHEKVLNDFNFWTLNIFTV